MQLANFIEDHWQLRNGEHSHRAHPETFWLPPLEHRRSLKIGDAAKVIIDIECKDDHGDIFISGERGYLIVAKVVGNKYIGILDFQPACIEQDESYLCFGAEIPFGPEHVIGIERPPKKYIDWQLGQEPKRVWKRLNN